MTKAKPQDGGDADQLRRGPWTLEEDNLLIHYISAHGEGRWNSLAQFSGLKRTGKSCRLRWLNYLKPDIKRGNLTPHEQLLILELHSKWGNRWSKIAQNLPGRTDNEIKNYWRTRVQKQARQLKIDSNSNKFLEAIRTFWMPRLLEKMEQESSITSPSSSVFNHVPVNESIPSEPAVNNLDMSNNSTSNFLVNYPEIPGYLTPQDSAVTCEKLLDKNGFYHVEAATRYQVDVQQDAIGLNKCHVSDADWFGEDLGNIFWSSDEEFWHLKKPEDFTI